MLRIRGQYITNISQGTMVVQSNHFCDGEEDEKMNGWSMTNKDRSWMMKTGFEKSR